MGGSRIINTGLANVLHCHIIVLKISLVYRIYFENMSTGALFRRSTNDLQKAYAIHQKIKS